ncbi:reverse transcriptase Ty1/copia-type domain-containing protein [Citrus sinensis]|uniref:Reverse transcriptase Ty1/copia-type domain-containing protein n=1 Tax=Citrus sinensis TaxID=2711 RepID=A0ACB8MA96_CITSI|nr:reverse transcriptase Ty1/copia-type domain-containing protein [Citrus sinensis]
MRDECEALLRNKTWSLVQFSEAYKVVDSKWVFRIKQNTDGSVTKYKARLVAKGFQQTEGVDYFETFSLMVKACTVRIIFSLAVMNKRKIRQVDVNNAFLNGELIEDVYMYQLEGFINEKKSSYVCELKKALYGLKQAPRPWYDKLKNCLIRPDSGELEKFILEFSKTFALKDLGILSYFFGIEVSYADGCMYLSQRKYINDLFSKADMLNCKGCDTPIVTGLKLQKEVKGYLAPTLQHIMACKRVLRYLKETMDYGLKFSAGGEMEITVSWSSKKQSVVTMSSTESEYRALASASAEITWIQSLFTLGIAKLTVALVPGGLLILISSIVAMLALWVAILRLIVFVVAILILIPTVRAIIKSWIAVSSLVRIKATVCLLFDCGIDSDSRTITAAGLILGRALRRNLAAALIETQSLAWLFDEWGLWLASEVEEMAEDSSFTSAASPSSVSFTSWFPSIFLVPILSANSSPPGGSLLAAADSLPTSFDSSPASAASASGIIHNLNTYGSSPPYAYAPDLVPPVPSHNLVGCKWVFRVKSHLDGSVDRYKAWLVAKGFTQRLGLDYHDTSSLVVKTSTVRVIFCLALQFGWPVRQLDINNAFLNGSLDEEVYMKQPPGFIDSNRPSFVCRLRKSLYGLKQAPRAWFTTLYKFLLSYGFRQSRINASLFLYHRDGHRIYFLVYDIDSLHHFLGLELFCTPSGVFLSQHHYVRSLLDRFGMTDAKPIATPLSATVGLQQTDGSVSADIAQGLLSVAHVPSMHQLADVLTKLLPRLPFERARSKLGVLDSTPLLRGRNGLV